MDYHAVHGHDIASFDLSSSHRLPTVSASAALDELASDAGVHIPTGLAELDKALAVNSPLQQVVGNDPPGGITRGQVTELWGPPGAGKTAFGIQLAARVLSDGKSVVWVDCFQTLVSQRLRDVGSAVSVAQDRPSDDTKGQGKLIHYNCLTLPHLVALISRPTAKSLPPDVGLVVFSSMTALINSSLPKSEEYGGKKRNNAPGPAARRRQALQSIMKALQTMASARNCAVVLLSQCATKMQSDRRATLIPAVSANVWEHGISTRIVLFKDWDMHQHDSTTIFLAGIQKLDGKATADRPENISAFKIESGGICSVTIEDRQSRNVRTTRMMRKRRLSQTNFEIPDSEDDEDYGWADEDEASMPAPPPQWQGSEDVLLGQEVGHSDDEPEDNNLHANEDAR